MTYAYHTQRIWYEYEYIIQALFGERTKTLRDDDDGVDGGGLVINEYSVVRTR